MQTVTKIGHTYRDELDLVSAGGGFVGIEIKVLRTRDVRFDQARLDEVLDRLTSQAHEELSAIIERSA